MGGRRPAGRDKGTPPVPQTTPVQNAVMAAAIANDGIVMDPFVVAQTLSPEGTVIKTTQPRSLGQAVSASTAQQVKEAMLDVVQAGSGGATAVARCQGRRQDRYRRNRYPCELRLCWIRALRQRPRWPISDYA